MFALHKKHQYISDFEYLIYNAFLKLIMCVY